MVKGFYTYAEFLFHPCNYPIKCIDDDDSRWMIPNPNYYNRYKFSFQEKNTKLISKQDYDTWMKKHPDTQILHYN